MQINQNRHFNRIKNELIPWSLCNNAVIYTKYYKHIDEWDEEEVQDEEEENDNSEEEKREDNEYQKYNLDDSRILKM